VPVLLHLLPPGGLLLGVRALPKCASRFDPLAGASYTASIAFCSHRVYYQNAETFRRATASAFYETRTITASTLMKPQTVHRPPLIVLTVFIWSRKLQPSVHRLDS
jgi:hypothetical protein